MQALHDLILRATESSSSFPMNNEDQNDSLLDWESALVAATAVDPILLRALDWNDNAPVFASHNDAFPNPPGDSGDLRNEAPRVPLPNLGTTLGDGDNGPNLQRSESLRHDEMCRKKVKKEETADYCLRKRAKSVEGHSMSEKRRRKRIRERLKALQALIPNSNKDTASMLDDAVRYLKLLKLQVETMSISYGYGGAQNLVQFEGGGGDAYQGIGIPILPRGCIPSPYNMSTCCYPPPMMSGFVPNLPPTMPMFPCLFNARHAQFSWPPAPPTATDYPDVPLIPPTFNDNIGECSLSAPEEYPRYCGHS